MSIKIACINVNGLQLNKKRNCIFEWLSSRKFDIICLQETHCTDENVNRWESEWKSIIGGESLWNCGTSNSRGIGILVNRKNQCKLTNKYQDDCGRKNTF